VSIEGTQPPKVPEIPVPVLTIEQLRALLDACKGRDFVSRRDSAIIRLLVDTGGRLSEVSGPVLDDVDLNADQVHVLGKGRRPRALPIGENTALALSRYLRVRGEQKWRTCRTCGWPRKTRAHWGRPGSG
jgi:site-specific recombinase XerC